MWEGERIEVLSALLKTNGNRSEAARNLMISRYALYRRLDLYEAIIQRDPGFREWAATHPW